LYPSEEEVVFILPQKALDASGKEAVQWFPEGTNETVSAEVLYDSEGGDRVTPLILPILGEGLNGTREASVHLFRSDVVMSSFVEHPVVQNSQPRL
jgi:hypothetical protein